MRRRTASATKIFFRFHKPTAKKLRPIAIDDDPSRQRVFRIDKPSREA
jgi:hypothetical protein